MPQPRPLASGDRPRTPCDRARRRIADWRTGPAARARRAHAALPRSRPPGRPGDRCHARLSGPRPRGAPALRGRLAARDHARRARGRGHRGRGGRPARARTLAGGGYGRGARPAHRRRSRAARAGRRARARPPLVLGRGHAPRAHAARGARARDRDRPLAAHADRRTGLTALGLPAAIVVALRGDTRVVGLLAVERNEPFGPRERRLLETVGSHAGNALETGQTARALAAVTELKERLAHEARHDPLTGLANRSLFSLRVEAALARDDNAPAVMFLDLDDFKGINDTLGHAAGDALLVTVAERLRASLREDDLAARLGGDEFAVLLEHAPTALVAERAAERVLGSLVAPLSVEGRAVRVGASIGVALASRRRGDRRRSAAQRRPRDVRGQGGRAVALRHLLARHAGRGDRPARARGRAARRHPERRHQAALPAARRARQRSQLGGRGTRPLAPPDAGPAAAGALHRARRGDRPDQRAGPRDAARGLPSGRGLARDDPGRRGARRLGQRLAAPARRRHVRRGRRRRRSSARTCRRRRSCWS